MVTKIVPLKGAERVRRRPAVIFGDIGDAGAMHAVEKMIHILASECVDGYSNRLNISLSKNNVVSISNNGRGIYFGEDANSECSIWKEMFCELYARSLYEDLGNREHRYSIFNKNCKAKRRKYLVEDDADLYLVSVQYASEFMEVLSVRDGYEYSLSFKKGENVGGLKKVPSKLPSGTTITFKLDTEVFSDYSLSSSQLNNIAELLALVNPGVFITVSTEGAEDISFSYPQGIHSYISAHNFKLDLIPVYLKTIKGVGQDRYNLPSYEAQIEVGIAFTKESGFVKCIHNQRELSYGGTHIRKLKERICQSIQYMLELPLSEAQLMDHLQLVVVSYSDGNPYWENGTRLSISNKVIRDMAEDIIDDNFRKYLIDHSSMIKKLFNPKK